MGIFFLMKKLSERHPFWISNTYSLQRVHQWRSEEASILVGKNTVLQDNPKLKLRDFEGKVDSTNCHRQKSGITSDKNFFDQSVRTIIYNAKRET